MPNSHASTGLVQNEETPREVVDPFTGELVTRNNLREAALLVRRIREAEAQFGKLKKGISDWFADYCDERAEWTVDFGGFKVSMPAPTAAEIDWDLDELHKLEALLPPERYGELVKQVVSEKPMTLKLQNAAKAGGEIGAIIERAQRRKPKTRYIAIKSA